MFLRKQTHRCCTWETSLSFQPTSKHTEAGTVVWMNYFTYSTLGIRKDNAGRYLRFQPPDGNFADHRLGPATTLTLIVDCGAEYKFGYLEDAEPDVHWIGSISNASITAPPPVGANFTGVMLGIYAFGERQRCLVPADFAYAEFR